jgi:putative restriction endonuclease
MARAIADVASGDHAAESQADYFAPRQKAATSRVVRDAAFARIIGNAYDRTCAMTGLRLCTEKGRVEIEAAHIRSVEENGPDSPRNGIALSRTIHWMFDRHWLAIGDEGEILVAKELVPDPVRNLLNPDMRIKRLDDARLTPHRSFVRFHRQKFTG